MSKITIDRALIDRVLEVLTDNRADISRCESAPYMAQYYDKAISAISEALAQPRQEPVALKKRRTLVEILAENWRVWPAQKAVEQTSLGDVYCSAKGRDLMFGNHEIALNQDSAVVTKEMWSATQESVGEVSGHDWSTGLLYRDLEPGSPPYTSPPSREPLSDEEAKDCLPKAPSTGKTQVWFTVGDAIKAIRNAEAAHGIKETK